MNTSLSSFSNNWISELFNDFFVPDFDFRPVNSFSAGALPAVNITEDDASFNVQMAVPGMQKEDVTIKLTAPNQLLVAMEKKTETKVDNTESAAAADVENANTTDVVPAASTEVAKVDAKSVEPKFIRHEFSSYNFQQSLTLPENVDAEKISAKVADGILYITMPKRQPAPEADNTRYIAID